MRVNNIKIFLMLFMVSIIVSGNNSNAQTAVIDLNSTHQTISGFGGINFPRWIADLTQDQADLAFGNKDGQLGLSILRISVAPDRTDWNKEVTTAKRAISYGAKVFGSPWSPPASMKSVNSIIGGHLNTSSYNAYADHLKDFCDFMAGNGVSLYAISVQNEPDIKVKYESCDWTSSQMIDFLKSSASRIGSTKIIAPESFNFNQTFSDAILNDAEAAKKVSIIGGHIYGNGLKTNPLAESKGKEIWMTEHYTTSDRSANLWPDALEVGKEIHKCMNANWNAYIWWYIRRSYGLITDDGKVSKRGYVFGHYSKFIRPGFVRVKAPASPSSMIYVTAYKNGTDVVIVAINENSSSKSQQFSLSGSSLQSFDKFTTSSSKNIASDGKVSVSGGSLTTTLDAQSITTLVGKGSVGTLQNNNQNRTLRNYPDVFNGSIILNSDGPFNYTIYDIAGTAIESGKGITTISAGAALRSGTYVVRIQELHSEKYIRVVKGN